MLAEGGMHVPFLIAWPDTIPGGQVYELPVSALDVAATAAALAGIVTKPGDLDGVNLLPHLTGEINVTTFRSSSRTAAIPGSVRRCPPRRRAPSP